MGPYGFEGKSLRSSEAITLGTGKGFPERNIIDRIFTRVKDAYLGSQKEFLIQFAERFLLGYHGLIFNWIVRLIRVLGRIFPWVC